MSSYLNFVAYSKITFLAEKCFVVLTRCFMNLGEVVKRKIIATADTYEISLLELLHLYNVSLKNLPWKHFAELVSF